MYVYLFVFWMCVCVFVSVFVACMKLRSWMHMISRAWRALLARLAWADMAQNKTVCIKVSVCKCVRVLNHVYDLLGERSEKVIVKQGKLKGRRKEKEAESVCVCVCVCVCLLWKNEEKMQK